MRGIKLPRARFEEATAWISSFDKTCRESPISEISVAAFPIYL
jgi:hypothetical protein